MQGLAGAYFFICKRAAKSKYLLPLAFENCFNSQVQKHLLPYPAHSGHPTSIITMHFMI